MRLTDNEYDLFYRKLEYRFKKSGHELVNKLLHKEDLTNEDIQLLIKKFEYTWRMKNQNIIENLLK